MITETTGWKNVRIQRRGRYRRRTYWPEALNALNVETMKELDCLFSMLQTDRRSMSSS